MSSKPPPLKPPRLPRRKSPAIIAVLAILVLLTYVLLMLAVFFSMRGCARFPFGSAKEASGIGVVEEGDGTSSTRTSEEAGSSEQPSNETTQSPPSTADSEQPQTEPSLSVESAPVAVSPQSDLPTTTDTIDSGQSGDSDAGNGRGRVAISGGSRGATFMGSRDEGAEVVFVIDASGSMGAHNSMNVAKSALVSSLEALEDTQKFLIIFYDNQPTLLDLNGEKEPQLYPATDNNKYVARRKLELVLPGAGTEHVPALEMALRLRPDVIFFLTDAQEPSISPSHLRELNKLNSKKTRIHSIEFGVGPEVSERSHPDNFLRKLSKQNGGSYRYFDVTKFK